MRLGTIPLQIQMGPGEGVYGYNVLPRPSLLPFLPDPFLTYCLAA